jgi:predicted nucleotidyltransferase
MTPQHKESSIGYDAYSELLDAFIHLARQSLGDSVTSVILYGSVARGNAKPESDIDVLVILRDASSSYRKRLELFLPSLRKLRQGPLWERLEERGLSPFLALLVLSEEEAKENRYLYLDMVDEARILVDRGGFFQAKLENLRQRLGELGARKVQHEGGWYWDLKPDLKAGETLIL